MNQHSWGDLDPGSQFICPNGCVSLTLPAVLRVEAGLPGVYMFTCWGCGSTVKFYPQADSDGLLVAWRPDYSGVIQTCHAEGCLQPAEKMHGGYCTQHVAEARPIAERR